MFVLHEDDSIRCIECHEVWRSARSKPAPWGRYVQKAGEPRGQVIYENG